MASGTRHLTINTLERAVSIDTNRLQSFIDADDGENWRALSNSGMGTDDEQAGALYLPNAGTGDPMHGEVYGGLVVQPQSGQLNLLVTPGVARVYDPDGSPSTDDSQYKLIVDPGIVSVGVLVMTPNVSGSIRIDYIEVQRTTVVLESASRDIYSPSTGLFTPALVTKVTADQFTYRVRLGTPGGGISPPASGWMPLAIASVPVGALLNDTITFWDVRPLVANRIFQPHNLQRSDSITEYANGAIDVHTSAAHPAFSMSVVTSATDFVGSEGAGVYRLGGYIEDPGGTIPIDMSNTFYQSGSLGTGPVYIYLLEPFGLPRWAWYSSFAFGTRVPKSPRGILVASTVAPFSTGNPSGFIALPTSTGLGGSTGKGICIAVTHATAGVIDGPMVSNGRVQYSAKSNGVGFCLPIFTAMTGVITSGLIGTFTPVAGTHYPPHARALIVEFNLTLSISTGVTYGFFLDDSVGNAVELGQFSTWVNSAATGVPLVTTVRVPFGVFNTPTLVARSGGPGTLTAATAQVIGWEL